MAVVFAVGCSDGNGFMPGGENGSHETVEKIDAPLFVYEILAERAAEDSTSVDILDMLSRRPPSGLIPCSLQAIPAR